jgi:hypothetical protein
MNTLEIIVLIFAILTIAKAIMFLFIKQKPMLKLVENVSKYTNMFSVVLAIGIIALGYLLLMQMSIIQVFAGVILGVGMMGLFFIQYPKPMTAMFKEMMKRKGAIFIGFFFFLVMSVWVIIELLF